MTTRNFVLRFAQRALRIYILEAAIVLAIAIAIGVHAWRAPRSGKRRYTNLGASSCDLIC
jgi:hypothetical protein